MVKNNLKKKKNLKGSTAKKNNMVKKSQEVEKTLPTTYEHMPKRTQTTVVEGEWTYWQEAMVLSELLGAPACKRRRRRYMK